MSIQNLKRVCIAAAGCAVLFGCASTISQPNVQEKPTAKTVAVHSISAQGVHHKIGQIRFSDGAQGLVIQTELTSLPAGPHGFHIHEKPSCAPAEKDGKMGAGLAAGGHYNPYQVPNHGTPHTGHLGDLPLLLVEADGSAKTTLIAPRLKVADITGRAIMIHAGGDNYSDDPKPLGGGGDRIACGVIE